MDLLASTYVIIIYIILQIDIFEMKISNVLIELYDDFPNVVIQDQNNKRK